MTPAESAGVLEDIGPITAVGATFSCSALAAGSTVGAGLAQAFTDVHLDAVGDLAVTTQLFAGEPASPVPTASPTPLSSCVGDGDGNGGVTVGELIVLVDIALGNVARSACATGAIGSSGDLPYVSDVIAAVNNAVHSCPTPRRACGSA